MSDIYSWNARSIYDMKISPCNLLYQNHQVGKYFGAGLLVRWRFLGEIPFVITCNVDHLWPNISKTMLILITVKFIF